MRISTPMHRPSLLLLLALVVAACDSSAPEFVEANSRVTVAYEGRLANGTVFDSSPATTFSLQQVVPGFRDGLIGMAVGEEKTFDIPPEQAYGEAGVVNPQTGQVIIPPNATLTFFVRVLAIQ
jgi:FKBP-type peptidyl-prolyl cis-trans isomerase